MANPDELVFEPVIGKECDRSDGHSLELIFRPLPVVLYEHMFVADTTSDPTSDLPDGASPADLPLELIERQIESLAARITADSARWLELVGEFDRREGWGGSGCRSTSEWIAWRCAVSPRAARENVRVARKLLELPLLQAGFARGELSYSKIRVLTRVADDESEADLIELARHATAAQLERMVRAARRVSTRDADEAQRNAFVRWFWDDDDGCLHVDAKLAPEDGALFLRALEAAQEGLHEQMVAEAEELADDAAASASHPEVDLRGPAGPRAATAPPFPTNAEGLAAMAENALARSAAGRSSAADRYQVLVHVDVASLATDAPGPRLSGPGACAVADGPGIAPETARRLACDCSLVAVGDDAGGTPVSAGQRTRSIPSATRRALVARDGRCQFPGCERHRFVDAHHIRHWAHGGESSLENLVLLCRHHHRLVHEGGFSMERDRLGRRIFMRPDGLKLEQSPRSEPPSRSRQPGRSGWSKRGAAARHAGPLLSGTGEPMDLASCVDAVLAAIGPD
jgi:Domain of unknown function (DUF222)/HNH endonuclease